MKTFLLLLFPFGIVTKIVPTPNPHIVEYSVIIHEDNNCLVWSKRYEEPNTYCIGDTINYIIPERIIIK